AVHRGAEGFRPEERPNQLTPRIHPHEGTRLPEMAEGLRARLGGGPVRLLLPADLIAQTPIVRGLFTETGQHAVEARELDRAGREPEVGGDEGGREHLDA